MHLIAPAIGARDLSAGFRWVIPSVPLATPLAVAAAWVLVTAQRGHPARMLLVALAVALTLPALAQDLGTTRRYHACSGVLGCGRMG